MFVAAGLPDPALALLTSATAAGKQLDRVYYLKGKALLEKNQSAAALASFQKSLALNPKAIDSVVAVAEIYSLQGNHARSFEMMQRALKIDPQSVPTLRHFTVEAMKSGHTSAAAESALQLISRSQSPEDLYLAGAVLLDAKQEENALHALQSYVAARPDDAQGWLAFGLANERLSHTGEATKAYDRSLQLNPNLAESEFHLGLLSKLQNDTSAATRHFERALQIDPRKARAFVEAGKLYLQSGQLPHSLELLQRAESLDPNDYETQYNLGLVLSKLGRVEESKQHIARYFQLYEGKSRQAPASAGTAKNPGF
jgi:tetratricopeptide (TPR) repeat protein